MHSQAEARLRALLEKPVRVAGVPYGVLTRVECGDLRAVLDSLEAMRGALRGLVENEGLEAFVHLDRGIGTATEAGKRWLKARDLLTKDDQ